jgi:hypothetical protein
LVQVAQAAQQVTMQHFPKVLTALILFSQPSHQQEAVVAQVAVAQAQMVVRAVAEWKHKLLAQVLQTKVAQVAQAFYKNLTMVLVVAVVLIQLAQMVRNLLAVMVVQV